MKTDKHWGWYCMECNREYTDDEVDGYLRCDECCGRLIEVVVPTLHERWILFKNSISKKIRRIPLYRE